MKQSPISKFRYNNLEFSYDRYDHHIGLVEVFILDMYRSSLLKKNDIVLDLGAGIGDFSVLASRRVGSGGKVIAIEPNPADYKLLERNIRTNNCSNVIPLNIGVGSKSKEEEISFWDRKYNFRVETLEDVLEKHGIRDRINFIKMDIEGFEAEVMEASIQTIAKADVISLELHGTKEKVDPLMLSSGFACETVNSWHICEKIMTNLLSQSYILFRIFFETMTKHPAIACKAIFGLDRGEGRFLNAIYVRK